MAGMMAARWTWGQAASLPVWGLVATLAVAGSWWLRARSEGRGRRRPARDGVGLRRGGGLATGGFLVAAFFVGGWYYLGWRVSLAAEIAPYAGKPHEWWGTVIREPVVRDGRLEMVVRLTRATVLVRVAGWGGESPGDPAGSESLPQASGGQGRPLPAVGHLVSVYGTAAYPSSPRNPGEFEYAGWLRAQGMGAVIRAFGPEAVQIRGKGRLGLAARAAAWLRSRFLGALRSYLPGVEGAVVEGMVLGIRSGLPPDVEDSFRRSGLVHLLAVSGSNVALVAGVMRSLLGWAGARPALAGSLVGTWVFAAAASGGASVGRAAVMATVMLLGRLLGRPSHPLNSLAVAVVVLTVLNPSAWEDPGFWLSVAATAGILGISGGPSVRSPGAGGRSGGARLLVGLVRGGREVLAVTCAAQAAVLPVSLYYFQQVSLVAPLSNVLVFPFTGAITVGGMASAALASVHGGLAVAFAPLGMLVRAVVSLARFWSEFPGAAATLPAPRWPHLLAYYLALAWVLGWLKWSLLPRHGPWTRPRLVLAVLVGVVALATSVATAPPRHVLQAVFFSVGQGDAILLWRPGGPAMLVDCGPAGESYDAGAATVVPYLKRFGIRRLDLLVLTHGHDDHTGGAQAVLSAVPVGEVWLGPGAVVPTGTGGHGSPSVRAPAAGHRMALAPGWEVTVLHPPAPAAGPSGGTATSAHAAPPAGSEGGEGEKDGQNDASLVLLVRYGQVSILLAADLEKEGEALFLREGARFCPEGVDLFKVPHHGSSTSCSAALLARVRPRFAVVQVGPNPFGHPAQATLRHLEEAGVRVWRTDRDGAVVARTDGRSLTVHAMLAQQSSRVAFEPGSARVGLNPCTSPSSEEGQRPAIPDTGGRRDLPWG